MAARASRPAQLRTPPQVARFRAGEARRAAQTAIGPGRERPNRWPADKQAILETLETLAGARAESMLAEVPGEH